MRIEIHHTRALIKLDEKDLYMSNTTRGIRMSEDSPGDEITLTDTEIVVFAKLATILFGDRGILLGKKGWNLHENEFERVFEKGDLT